MITPRPLVIAALVLCALFTSSCATTDAPTGPNHAQEKDPRGMRTWQLALLRRGPNYHTPKGDERSKVFQGHFANMSRLAKLGKLRLAGPLVVPENGPKDAFAGLFLLDVETPEEALELCRTDPTIQSGVFRVEVLTWYGPSDITYRGDTYKQAITKQEK